MSVSLFVWPKEGVQMEDPIPDVWVSTLTKSCPDSLPNTIVRSPLDTHGPKRVYHCGVVRPQVHRPRKETLICSEWHSPQPQHLLTSWGRGWNNKRNAGPSKFLTGLNLSHIHLSMLCLISAVLHWLHKVLHILQDLHLCLVIRLRLPYIWWLPPMCRGNRTTP